MKNISDMKFGSEWEPKLLYFMGIHPWPDSDFVPPTGENVTPEFIATALEQWRRAKAEVPTQAAIDAWKSAHKADFDILDFLFREAGVDDDQDIVDLGCTGFAAHGLALDDIKFLRMGLAGSGVGLPCYVPPNRYCLVHEVSGGLQDRQEQRYVEHVDFVARPLTPAEEAHDKLVLAARKAAREHGAHAMLHGHELPQGWEQSEGGETLQETVEDGGIDDIVAATRAPLFAWKCDEHDKTNWACRHCVAQAIVEGELTPWVCVMVGDATVSPVNNDIGQTLASLSVDSASVYVRAATFTRKLSRD